MSDFFQKAFYGNTTGEWLFSMGLVLGSFILAKAFYWVVSKFLKQLTQKTKTKLDDIIVDKVEEPTVFAILIAGIWYALSILTKGEGVEAFLQKVYYILIIFNISWMIARLFDALVDEYLVPLVDKSESSLDDQLLPIFRKGSKFALWTLAVILALNNAGYDVGALIAGLGIGGLAFALAAQDLVKNLFGGFTIFVDKPFMVGDRINVSGYDGFVEEIGIRSLRIRTLAGRLVILPNSDVANSAIENISSEPTRKVNLSLGLTYDMDKQKIQQAIDLLTQIGNSCEHIHEDQLPDKGPTKKFIATFAGFGDFSLNITFIYYIKKEADIFVAQNDVNLAILKAFNDNGLDFAFPTQTIITQTN